jgi:hypothetical protein
LLIAQSESLPWTPIPELSRVASLDYPRYFDAPDLCR